MNLLLALALCSVPVQPPVVDDVAALRAEGPSALARLLERYRALPPGGEKDALQATIDAVAAQRYATYSGLYWYTDLAQAEDAARASDKPILSLRMLGRLDEDLSCANSRFFRVALYANQNVSQFLRENFVLHWSSERPVPKVTIDFGDGRAIHTTLAGNSAHYVLDADGRVMDVLPGLYSPVAFQRELEALLPLLRLSPELADRERVELIENVWGGHMATLSSLWHEGPSTAMPPVLFPEIVPAENLAISKSLGELPMIPSFLLSAPKGSFGFYRNGIVMRLDEARLDPSSKALFDRLVGDGADPATLANFELSMAADTMQNELRLRPVIHSISGQPWGRPSFEELNRIVYDQVFRTPATDPWLGMLAPRVFNALPNGGITR